MEGNDDNREVALERSRRWQYLPALDCCSAHRSRWAQSRDTGAINGVVTDESGGVLPGATVTLLREDRGTAQTAVTDARGSYRFAAVRRGTYSVVASMDGFSSARQDDVRLSTQQTRRVDFSLTLGSVTETVQVSAIPPLMDVQGSELATTQLSNEVLMNIPTGKNIPGIVKLTPGVHNANPGGRSGTDGRGYSAYGGSDQGIQYAIDGMIINSPEAGEAETPLGFDSLEEINVMGLGAPAEYDGFDGVVVNATTKSGSNDIRGLVDLTFTDDDWVSSNTDDEDLERRGFFSTRQTYHVDAAGPSSQTKCGSSVRSGTHGRTRRPTRASPRARRGGSRASSARSVGR